MSGRTLVATVLHRPVLDRPVDADRGAVSAALILVRVEAPEAEAGATIVVRADRQLGAKAADVLRRGTRVILVLRAPEVAADDRVQGRPGEVERFAIVGRSRASTQFRRFQYPIDLEPDGCDSCA